MISSRVIEYMSPLFDIISNSKGKTIGQIKEELKTFLPAYMIPKKILPIDSIPMNNHGKVDRKYLGGLLA